MCAARAWNHKRGPSSVPCQHAAQDICQHKRHIPCPHRHHILPSSFHRKTRGYFWGYSGIQDGCSSTDYSLERDGKQRTWYGSRWLGGHAGKCLGKQHKSAALMSDERCLYSALCFPWGCPLSLFVAFFYLHSENIVLLWSRVSFLGFFLLNESQTRVKPRAVTQMCWHSPDVVCMSNNT